MATSQLTIDLKKIVTKVSGTAPKAIFNDKRVTFQRRYKFAGIRDLSDKQLAKIERKISERHPGLRFEVQNKKTAKAKWPNHNAFTGLTIKVL